MEGQHLEGFFFSPCPLTGRPGRLFSLFSCQYCRYVSKLRNLDHATVSCMVSSAPPPLFTTSPIRDALPPSTSCNAPSSVIFRLLTAPKGYALTPLFFTLIQSNSGRMHERYLFFISFCSLVFARVTNIVMTLNRNRDTKEHVFMIFPIQGGSQVLAKQLRSYLVATPWQFSFEPMTQQVEPARSKAEKRSEGPIIRRIAYLILKWDQDVVLPLEQRVLP